MSEASSQNHFFIPEEARPIIEVEGHSHRTDKDVARENAKIRIDPSNAEFELEISIPKESLKKLIIAARKFLETGKRACFIEGEFRVGEIREEKVIPAKEALKGAF